MENINKELQTAFIKNRTEELGYDVWEQFVVPPFFNSLDLKEARKACVIIGGRGCGKTMLLRYLSHQSSFSPKRSFIPDDAISHIGLYWRLDTQSANVMHGRNLPDDIWVSAFNHFLAIEIGIQILQSIQSIAKSASKSLSINDLSKLSFDTLSTFDKKFTGGLDTVLKAFEEKLTIFEMWLSNVRTIEKPVFLSGKGFLKTLISQIKEQLLTLKEAIFFVYIDEFENLIKYQQRIINTLIKHSESPLIFNIAMKRNGFVTRKTMGEESITDIADYRKYDLEDLQSNNFSLFAAEVAFLNLALAGIEEVPINIEQLRDTNTIRERDESAYREMVLTRIRSIFPSFSHRELAQTVFDEKLYFNKLKKSLEQALKKRNSKLPVESFIRSEQQQASIVTTALLYRQNLEPEKIIRELDLLTEGKDNCFTGSTAWIHNNFIGCLLSIYEPFSRPCPFYAGFDTFCLMSKGNLRHFLELCHKSINQTPKTIDNQVLRISPINQANAARQTASAFLAEIRSFGRLGNRLHTFVLRLGSLFNLAHSRKNQSEPEQNHFAFTHGALLKKEYQEFLSESVKWSVLFEEKETKLKNFSQTTSLEYVLNPIYAPYFQISYRKRHKLEISTNDFTTLVHGSYEEYQELMRKFSRQWEIKLQEANPTLFTHLLEE